MWLKCSRCGLAMRNWSNRSLWNWYNNKSILSTTILRNYSTSNVPPSSNQELPKGSWWDHYKANKSSYNRQLAAGAVLTAGAMYLAYRNDLFSTSKPAAPATKDDDSKPKRLKPYSTPDLDLPDRVPYLLIGAGTASFAAFRSIKARDPTAQVLLVGDEGFLPYMRPPLSKELWFSDEPQMASDTLQFTQWSGKKRSLFFEPIEFYISPPKSLSESETGGVSVAMGRHVTQLDVDNQLAILENGRTIGYDKCLIATGGAPKCLPVFDGIKDKVTLYRNIDDFRKLEKLSRTVRSVVVLGGGFLGSELACALCQRKGLEVVQLFSEDGHMGKVLPTYLSQWTTERIREEGVNVVPNVEVSSAEEKGDRLLLTLSDGHTLQTDHVVVAVGLQPIEEMGKKSGLETDPVLGGYRVNSELQARSNVWVAGDAACFYDPLLGRRRVEHHDHAVVSGRLAGENMALAGKETGKSYTHQSMFWSDLGPKLGYEAIGLVDSTLPTVAVFAKATAADSPQGALTSPVDDNLRAEIEAVVQDLPVEVSQKSTKDNMEGGEDYGKGVVFYLKDGIVVGVLLWNVFNRVGVARKVLKDGCRQEDLSEVAKLFSLHTP